MSAHKLPRVTFADVVIEAMPFSDELIKWCNSNPGFKEALKATNPDRFIALGQIVTSHSKNSPNDEIIGFFTYDYTTEKFKQDFIVNIDRENRVFVLYTSLPKEERKLYGADVKHIKEFFAKYGQRGDYAGTHHPSLAEIEGLNNPVLTDRARRYIKLGAKLKQNGRNSVTQDKLRETLHNIRSAKEQRLKLL